MTRLSVADTSLNDWHLGFHISLVCFSFMKYFFDMFCVVHFVGAIIASTPSALNLVSYFFYQFYQNYVHFPQEEAFLADLLNIFLESSIVFTEKLVQILKKFIISPLLISFRLNNSGQSKDGMNGVFF